jgi:hypothetical protein
MFITSPKVFADLFNGKFPGAYRKITPDDVRLMTECKLIGRYKYYIHQDLETISCILLYEQLRINGSAHQDKEKNPPTCKRFGKTLPTKLEDKVGRPREYCSDCESFRNREQQKKLRYWRYG